MAPLGGAPVWDDVLQVVGALEAAHPALAQKNGPQLEYPWESVTGEIQWPAEHLQEGLSLERPTSTLAVRVLRFATSLSERFDQIFP